MKNIFVLPSDKPSRLWINNLLQGKLELSDEVLIGSNTAVHVYITNSEEIKEGDYVLNPLTDYPYKADFKLVENSKQVANFHIKKIILATDPELIKNGVQSIDDDFLEWFVKNSSCEFVEVKEKFIDKQFNSKYVPIIPQPKQETIEEVNKRFKEYLETADEETRRMYGHHLRSFTSGWNRKAKFEQSEKDNFAIGFYHFINENYTEIKGLFDLKETPYWNFKGKTIEELLQVYKSHK